jgi:hypothetical protein
MLIEAYKAGPIFYTVSMQKPREPTLPAKNRRYNAGEILKKP